VTTPEEIDRAKGEHVAAANAALSTLAEAGARWWQYSVSHQTLELLIGDAAGKDNIVVWLTGCERISGPVSWEQQRLRVVWECDRSRRPAWWFHVVDEAAGFRAEAATFGWTRRFDLMSGSPYFGARSQP
jgi:hypothetical protein